MKNIFVEGIQGSGKSTLVQKIAEWNPKLCVCREGDYNPIELAWCALMTAPEYGSILEKYGSMKEEIVKNTVKEQEHYIITYTKIPTDIPGFYKEMERFEVYNGRKPWAQLKEIILTRFKNFRRGGYLFECSFFQNIIEDLILFHERDDEEIKDFYKELFHEINTGDFVMLYLYEEDLEESIRKIKKERCDEKGNEVWYQMMLEYLTASPYGKRNGYSTFDDLIEHLKHRQELELSIIREIIGDKAVVLPAKKYDINQIIFGSTESKLRCEDVPKCRI